MRNLWDYNRSMIAGKRVTAIRKQVFLGLGNCNRI